VDQRSTTFEKSIHMGKEFQRRAKAMILRAAVLRNQIHVKVGHAHTHTHTHTQQYAQQYAAGELVMQRLPVSPQALICEKC